ncbi:TolC family protein [soil metagenome]
MIRKRLATKMLTGLMGLASLNGCAQPLYMDPADKAAATTAVPVPPGDLENHPHSPIAPSDLTRGMGPSTVLDPSRTPRPMTLKECIAIALESGNTGLQGGVQNAGNIQDNAFNFAGQSVAGTDTIRALVLDPAIVGANIEKALSKFDARFITSMSWNTQDQAVLNLQQSFSNGESASFSSTLAKPLPTGGVAGVTFSTNYQNLSNPPTQNQFVTLPTSYSPRLQFIFEQPLLQGFGVEINQLTTQHPGSLLLNGLRASGGTTTEGILITRLRYDEQKADFNRQVNQMLLNVEYAYWNLYAAYYNLYAQEYVLKQAFELYILLKKRVEAGAERMEKLTQTSAQYWQFRQQSLSARQQVLSAERQLRGLLGMNSFSDNQRLVPVDLPVLAPYTPDYFEMANEALAFRPELLIGRMDLKYRQLDLLIQKNQRRPDLRSFASYDVNGLGARLDGSATTTVNGVERPNNALASFGSNQFNSWQLGLRLDMPLGFRDANAAVRQARLNIVRSYYQLQDAERKTLENLTQQHREVVYRSEDMKLARSRRQELETTLALQQKFIDAGSWDVNSLFNILQVQRDVASAIATEFQSIAQYNQALSALEYVKGTIQRYNNVSVGEAPLPAIAAKKAADHFSARNAAFKLHERENANTAQGLPTLDQPWTSTYDNLPPLPNVPSPGAPSAPAPLPVPPGMSAPAAPATPTAPMPKPVTKSNTGDVSPNSVQPWPGNNVVPVNAGPLPSLPAEEAIFKPVGTVQPMRRP